MRNRGQSLRERRKKQLQADGAGWEGLGQVMRPFGGEGNNWLLFHSSRRVLMTPSVDPDFSSVR